jgi:hypothetical protein
LWYERLLEAIRMIGTILENSSYKVNIKLDRTFTLDSKDNGVYQMILNPCEQTHTDYYNTFSITIDDRKYEKHLALIGSIWGSDEDAAILEGNDLIVLMDNLNCPYYL